MKLVQLFEFLLRNLTSLPKTLTAGMKFAAGTESDI
jgi:hypothetical protein